MKKFVRVVEATRVPDPSVAGQCELAKHEARLMTHVQRKDLIWTRAFQ